MPFCVANPQPVGFPLLTSLLDRNAVTCHFQKEVQAQTDLNQNDGHLTGTTERRKAHKPNEIPRSEMYNVATKEAWCHIFAKDTCDFEF